MEEEEGLEPRGDGFEKKGKGEDAGEREREGGGGGRKWRVVGRWAKNRQEGDVAV